MRVSGDIFEFNWHLLGFICFILGRDRGFVGDTCMMGATMMPPFLPLDDQKGKILEDIQTSIKYVAP